MKDKEQKIERALETRLAHVPKGNKAVEAAMRIENKVKRGEALYEAGFCSDGYGTCHAADGKIAPRWKNEKGVEVTFCKFHTMYQRKMATLTASKAKPKAAKAKATKKVTVLPTKKAVDNIKAALEASKTHRIAKAAEPPMPKDMK
jgi:hypothetical protein